MGKEGRARREFRKLKDESEEGGVQMWMGIFDWVSGGKWCFLVGYMFGSAYPPCASCVCSGSGSQLLAKFGFFGSLKIYDGTWSWSWWSDVAILLDLWTTWYE